MKDNEKEHKKKEKNNQKQKVVNSAYWLLTTGSIEIS